MKLIYKIFVATSLALCASSAWAEVNVRQLNENWRFRQGRSDIWYPAVVPGTVHTDLIANEIIDDPFFRLNERAVQWVDKRIGYTKLFSQSGPMNLRPKIRNLYFSVSTHMPMYISITNVFFEPIICTAHGDAM